MGLRRFDWWKESIIRFIQVGNAAVQEKNAPVPHRSTLSAVWCVSFHSCMSCIEITTFRVPNSFNFSFYDNEVDGQRYNVNKQPEPGTQPLVRLCSDALADACALAVVLEK